MASASEILNSPDYINANAATKEAIFNKHIAVTPDFTGANADTQSAIRQRFGLATVAAGEGMPAPRQGTLDAALNSGYTNLTGRNLPADLQQAKDITSLPSMSDLGGNIALRAQEAAQTAKQGGESAVENFKAGRPASAVLGAGQQLLGGAGILMSPFTGAVKTYVGDPLEHWLGYGTGEKANMIAETVLAPPVVNALGKVPQVASNLGVRAYNAGENLFNPVSNALIKSAGAKAPEIAETLRASTSGIEPAGQAAAPVRSTGFSQLAQAVGEHAPDVVDEAKLLQNKVLEARANIAQGKSTEAAQTLADAVAEPNVQKVGDNLINIAEKEKQFSSDNVIGPKFKAAEVSGNGKGTDISGLLNKANELVDTIDPKAAEVLSRRLAKFKGETTTPEYMGPGGATYKGKPVTAAPTATLEDIGDIRSAINNAAAKALSEGADRDVKRLMDLHAEVTDAVKNSSTLSQKTKDLYFDAVKTYADEHATRFKTGLQVNLFKIRDGKNAITPSNVIDKFFKNADTTDDFVALFGKNPEAMNEAQQGMEGLYRNKVIKDGAIDTEANDAFMKKYGAQIDKLDATGLNIRDKFDTLANETARVTSPEANIAEVSDAINSGTAAEGAVNTAVEAKARAITNAASPEDLTSLRDAVQVARRQADYKDLLATPNAKQVGVPIVPSKSPSFLNTKLRAVSEIFRRIAGKLDTKMSEELGAMMSDPTRLNEVADLIDKAIAMKARQTGRIVSTNINTPYASVLGLNALAPQRTNQNALAP